MKEIICICFVLFILVLFWNISSHQNNPKKHIEVTEDFIVSDNIFTGKSDGKEGIKII